LEWTIGVGTDCKSAPYNFKRKTAYPLSNGKRDEEKESEHKNKTLRGIQIFFGVMLKVPINIQTD
jgi:hypothetical protein